MSDNDIEIRLTFLEQDADNERIDDLVRFMIKDFRDLGVKTIQFAQSENNELGSKGDLFTIGALILVIAPALLPQVLTLMQSWLIERRKIVVEAPNGAKLEFVPERKYSESEILALVKKLNRVTSTSSKPGKENK